MIIPRVPPTVDPPNDYQFEFDRRSREAFEPPRDRGGGYRFTYVQPRSMRRLSRENSPLLVRLNSIK